ncbi:hypothetical protein KKF55_03355 [Patescibacteria group bacterium]|nr:hypothetical protein [Patescibacteria group bacterium]
MEIHRISRKRYLHTMFWAVLCSMFVVSVMATLGRASYNFSAALTDKPDIAIYVLLPEEEITSVEILRDKGDERHYLAETKNGPKLVILKMGNKEWFVSQVEELRE